jgi:hypothetical protein
MAGWRHADDLFGGLARWVTASELGLPPHMLVTQEVERGVQKIRLHLDPQREVGDLPGAARVVVVQGRPGQEPQHSGQGLTWLGADTLGADIPLASDSAAVATVHVDGVGRVALAPVCLPYSPELAPAENDTGSAALDRLTGITGGRRRLRPETIWDEIPTAPRPVELASLLYLLAAGLLLAEVLERRTGLVSRALRQLRWSLKRLRPVPKPAPVAVADAVPATETGPETGEQVETTKGTDRPTSPPAEPGRDLIDAMARARSRARRRTGSGDRSNNEGRS